MPKNVTYLLGAGASASSLPTITTLTKNIGDLAEDIKRTPSENYVNPDEVIRFAEDLDWLYQNAQHHLTVDTLAKKLFLSYDSKGLERLKRTLSLFFTVVQSTNGLDKRYDALLASLLELGNHHPNLPENIKILTWNYDIQLELSASRYMNLSLTDTMEQISSFPPIRIDYLQLFI